MRTTRQELMIAITREIAKRSTCTRRNVGAVIAIDFRPVSWGYNGSPPGMPHCIDVGCLIGPDGGCTRTQHAERNAIIWAARKGISVEGATLWTSVSPCVTCAQVIITAGIKEVYSLERYRDRAGVHLLREMRIPVHELDLDPS